MKNTIWLWVDFYWFYVYVRIWDLLVDSWYAKPNFINEVKENGIDVIARIANNPKIWQFIGKYNTLESLYIQTNKTKTLKLGNYNSIKYTYVSTTTTHKTLGRIKIVFIKTKDNLIPIEPLANSNHCKQLISSHSNFWD